MNVVGIFVFNRVINRQLNSASRQKKLMSGVFLTLLVAFWLMLVMNLNFWRTVWEGVGGWENDSWLFLATLPFFVLLWIYLLISLLTWGRFTKPVLCLFVIVSSVVSYFMNSYGILIDATMLENVLQTDPAEATELFNWRLVLWVVLLGVVPAILISKVPLLVVSWQREILVKLASTLVVVLGFGFIALAFYQPYASLLRNHREVRLMLVPSNILLAVNSYAKQQAAASRQLEIVGADAKRISESTRIKPRVMVIVVGETARAANFGLNGYSRQTTPQLAALEDTVINFSNVTSCGTATAVSVPCMFQEVGRSEYREPYREGLLDIIQRAGMNVLWRDNNSGCKGACDRVPSEDVSKLKIVELCSTGECHDEILLHNLQGYLDKLTNDTVIVLHMKGSHGPAYYRRYPKAFEQFKPVCQESQLDRCSQETIVNAYDNTILYTDYVLAKTIKLLSEQDKLDTAMWYVSDHGESLGERGLYLHGIPYAIAPNEQTHVPMVLWMSQGVEKSVGLNRSCLRLQANKAVSHDNLFHSVLGFMGVETHTYRAERDIFRSCRVEN